MAWPAGPSTEAYLDLARRKGRTKQIESNGYLRGSKESGRTKLLEPPRATRDSLVGDEIGAREDARATRLSWQRGRLQGIGQAGRHSLRQSIFVPGVHMRTSDRADAVGTVRTPGMSASDDENLVESVVSLCVYV